MRTLFVVFLVVPKLAFAAVSPVDPPRYFGNIHSLVGQAERRILDGAEMKTITLKAREKIQTNEVIATESDGIVSIQTTSGDTLTLFPSSRVLIRHADEGKFQVKLVHGKLKVKTRDKFAIGKGHRLEIQTFNTVLGPTGPSEFTVYRDVAERCQPMNSPQCPSEGYWEEATGLLKKDQLFSSLYVTRARSPLYVGLVNDQQWDLEKYIKLGTLKNQAIDERQWVIISGNKFQKSNRSARMSGR